jgi:hypothetical protein
MGYDPSTSGSRQAADALAKSEEKDSVPMPDVSSMRPFKFEYRWNPRLQPVHEGVLSVPPVAADFCRLLPPWHCFPPVAVDLAKLTHFLGETMFLPVKKPLNKVCDVLTI